MQTQRLFEIVYILLRRKKVTAKELADHFEVSTRTIYRDLDALTMAGIPLYTNKGTGGGIFLMEDYTLSNSLLSDEEKNHVLSALQSYHIAKKDENITSLLDKLSAQFRKEQIQWIDVDFNDWSGETQTTKIFQTIKDAIFEKKTISFTYYNSYGQMKRRHVEPFRLMFKGSAWYLIGYCLDHEDQRMFKLYRMEKIQKGQQDCIHRIDEEALKASFHHEPKNLIHITAHVDASLAYRLYDEYTTEDYERLADGSFLLHVAYTLGEWVYSYLMGFGPGLQVVEPLALREEIQKRHRMALENYEGNSHEC